MRFVDIAVYPAERYSLGIEVDSGRLYLSIPVSNSLVDYDEYYEIDQAAFQRYRVNLESAREFAARCRNRELDDRLFGRPGGDRGTPA